MILLGVVVFIGAMVLMKGARTRRRQRWSGATWRHGVFARLAVLWICLAGVVGVFLLMALAGQI